jgi:hypothetical protein
MVAIGIGVLVLALGAWGLFIWNVKTVERPEYQRVEADGAIELRDYPPLMSPRWTPGATGSRACGEASHIFARSRARAGRHDRAGDETPREQIAMTAPVTQTAREDGRWTVRFIMPAAYTLESLPEPADGVRLERLPARRAAAIRFAGWATDARVAAQEAELRTWIERRGLRPVGPPTYAYYDDPWMPGPLRRNEVLLDVSPE